jgi:dephospho-CoA kinase
MLVIGLTGGIGSGKSTVAALFAALHVPIIDTDVIAHELTQPKTPAYLSIVKHFGKDLVLSDGLLNRAQLSMMIFSDSKKRLWLERLLHPLIRDEMERKIHQCSAPYCIAVIPLLFEVEFYSMINRILVVDSPLELQIERIRARDHFPLSHIQAILKTQASRSHRLARADDIITNDQDLTHLKNQVEKLHAKYLKLSSEPL